MEFRRLVSQLQELDVTEDQAEVYLRLLQVGPAKVSGLSAFFEMSRSKLYRLLDELCDMGFASKSLGRPIEYAPTAPEAIFDVEIERLEQRCKRLEGLRASLAESLADLRGTATDHSAHHWKLLEGIPQIYETLKMAVGKAEETVLVASNHNVSTQISLPFADAVWRMTCQRASDGLDVRLIMDITEIEQRQLEDGYDMSALEVRKLRLERTVHFAIIDEREALIWARPEPSGIIGQRDEVAVWTDAPGILTTHSAFFDRLWEESAEITA